MEWNAFRAHLSARMEDLFEWVYSHIFCRFVDALLQYTQQKLGNILVAESTEREQYYISVNMKWKHEHKKEKRQQQHRNMIKMMKEKTTTRNVKGAERERGSVEGNRESIERVRNYFQ